MVRIIKIIISVILIAILVIFPIMILRYVNFKADKKMLTVIEKSNNYMNMLNLAEQNFNTNEDNADSAPKQTVVALWSIRDTQSILVVENNEMLNQNNNLLIKSDQISVLLFYLIFSILLIGVIAILLFIWKTELKLEKVL